MVGHSRYLTGEPGKQTRPKVIEFRQFTAMPEGQAAVHDITFDIFEGEVVALAGTPNAGQKTLLACLQGQIQPIHGEVHVFGVPLPPLTAEIRRQIGVLPQKLVPRPAETVMVYLQRFASYHNIKLTREQSRKYCSSYQIQPALPVTALNRLQARICALALALVHDPRLVLLDDPLANLTEEEQAAFWLYLQRIRCEGRTILCTFTSPLAEKYLNGYDLIISIEQGKLLRQEH